MKKDFIKFLHICIIMLLLLNIFLIKNKQYLESNRVNIYNVLYVITMI